MKLRDLLSVDDKKKFYASAAKMRSFPEKNGKRSWESGKTPINDKVAAFAANSSKKCHCVIINKNMAKREV
ncbi:hypothetical protein [Bacillus haynesii]|uniref:hypothetical protein n=1 Tax=Bacillus haynesii TaxID=1925021 RepID=UPI003B9812B4